MTLSAVYVQAELNGEGGGKKRVLKTEILNHRPGWSSHIFDKKLLDLIFLIFCFLISFLWNFIGSCFKICVCLAGLKRSHNHSGYSSSFKATGSLPAFLIWRLRLVPSTQLDFGAALAAAAAAAAVALALAPDALAAFWKTEATLKKRVPSILIILVCVGGWMLLNWQRSILWLGLFWCRFLLRLVEYFQLFFFFFSVFRFWTSQVARTPFTIRVPIYKAACNIWHFQQRWWTV